MPEWVARMPQDVGYPAGGSLTSDEWKALAMVYCPIIVSFIRFKNTTTSCSHTGKIPLIWEEWSEAAEAEYHKKTKLWQKEEAKRLKRIEKGKRKADGTEETPRPKPRRRMHLRDADNFLSLAAALKILLARSIEIADLDRAQELLQDFLDGFMEARLDAMITQFPC